MGAEKIHGGGLLGHWQFH